MQTTRMFVAKRRAASDEIFELKLEAGGSVVACRCAACGTFNMVEPKAKDRWCVACGKAEPLDRQGFLALIAEVAAMQEESLVAREEGRLN